VKQNLAFECKFDSGLTQQILVLRHPANDADVKQPQRMSQPHADQRVVIGAPMGGDASAMSLILEGEGIRTEICDGMEGCSREILAGAGALLLTEEALESPRVADLLEVLKAQPPWSELPVIILTRGGESRRAQLLDVAAAAAGAVTLLERPLTARTLVRSVEVALRSRRRQYQVRDLLNERKAAEAKLRDAQEQLQQHAVTLERTVAERTARLNETVQELEGFSYSIAHDMRAPLRAMLGFSEILMEEHGDQLNEQVKSYIERISTSANRLDQMIQDVLTYSRVVRGDIPLSQVNTEKLLRDIVESYPNLQQPNVRIEIAKPLPVVQANPAALTQVFSNILGNAVKFVAPGVPPRVKIHAEPAPTNKGSARFWFEDNGIGIEPEAAERIFQMFQRLNRAELYEGTGVGLAIVRKAIERMNGNIGVESEAGRGSRFWVELKTI
jgi:signal transduction histidine kinase